MRVPQEYCICLTLQVQPTLNILIAGLTAIMQAITRMICLRQDLLIQRQQSMPLISKWRQETLMA